MAVSLIVNTLTLIEIKENTLIFNYYRVTDHVVWSGEILISGDLRGKWHFF